MSVFDTGSQTVNLDKMSSNGAGKVREVGERHDNPNFGSMSGRCAQTENPNE
jgi:hypothetical protein